MRETRDSSHKDVCERNCWLKETSMVINVSSIFLGMEFRSKLINARVSARNASCVM